MSQPVLLIIRRAVVFVLDHECVLNREDLARIAVAFLNFSILNKIVYFGAETAREILQIERAH